MLCSFFLIVMDAMVFVVVCNAIAIKGESVVAFDMLLCLLGM